MSVVVVASHPDDELLGAGGTLARHVQDGEEVHAVLVTEGATSRYSPVMADVLRRSAMEAADRIGFASVTFQSLPDQRLDTLPLIEVTQGIEEILERLDPTVVYTHFDGDANADHGIVSRAVQTACRPYRFPRLRLLAAFETPSSTEWGETITGEPFRPRRFVDIGKTLETKLAAMACYGSELREEPHPRSLRALECRAATWGSVIGVAAAEPFVVIREIL
jgi:LmbE family N-acetylglucosaminyl deacetylase